MTGRARDERVVRVGIAHHYGWAVAVTATADGEVVDRRRLELIEPGLPAAPVHHEGGPHDLHRSGPPLDDPALATLVAQVRASVVRSTTAALEALAADVTATRATIASISLRAWPPDFPTDIAVLRRTPYEAKADSVMYRQVLADVAAARGWSVDTFDAATIEAQATGVLGERAHDVLHGPRRTLGAPWAKDHRLALAATVVAAASTST